jgi:hypothetical protein
VPRPGPSRPPAPLEAATTSSGFRPAAHSTETPSTSPCTYCSPPTTSSHWRATYLAGAVAPASGTGRRRGTPPPGAPPPQLGPQTGPVVSPRPSSTHPGPSPASPSLEFRPEPPAAMPEDHIASPQFFSGALALNCISNNICKFLNVVKCVKNHTKFRKMQTQFCWISGENYYNFCYTHIV